MNHKQSKAYIAIEVVEFKGQLGDHSHFGWQDLAVAV